jgi:hypothetical protein
MTLTPKETTMQKQTIQVGEKYEGGLRVVAVETVKSAKTITTDLYFVRQQVSDIGGMAFHFEKMGDASSTYDVLLNAPGGGHTCECWGSMRWTPKTGKPCRHVTAALQIIRGK